MKKSISIFVILAFLGFKESLYSQENESADHLKKQKDSKFFILELGLGNTSFVYTSSIENRDFKNFGAEAGIDLLLNYRFTSFFDLGVGGFFNSQIFTYNNLVSNNANIRDFSSSISTGWNVGGQVRFLFFPEVLISPYMRISIGYDRTTEILEEDNVRFDGIRYIVSGGISLSIWKYVRIFIEGGLFGKNNISVSSRRLITIDMPNIQDSIGFVIRVSWSFNIYFN